MKAEQTTRFTEDQQMSRPYNAWFQPLYDKLRSSIRTTEAIIFLEKNRPVISEFSRKRRDYRDANGFTNHDTFKAARYWPVNDARRDAMARQSDRKIAISKFVSALTGTFPLEH